MLRIIALSVFATFAAALSVCSQSQALLINNANVVDVKTGKVLTNASVLVQNGIIQDVSVNKKYKLPEGTMVIDGASKYVIPGMTDGHIHFSQSGGLYTRPDAFDFGKLVPYEKERENTFANAGDFLHRYLRMGITTVADVGGPFSNFAIRDSISKQTSSPTVLVTGPLFSMVSNKSLDDGDPIIVKTTRIGQADSLFNKMLPYKPDFIKIWYIVTPELPAEKTFPVVQHIAKRTHAAGLKLAVHATELKTAMLAVDAGADILVHSVEDAVVTDEFLKHLVSKKVSYIPTLAVVSGYMQTMSGALANKPVDLEFANPFFHGSLSDPEHLSNEEIPSGFQRFRAMKSPPSYIREDSIMAVNLLKLFRGGVNVVAGTDAGNVGTMHASSFLTELEAMKKAGLTNAQILRTATANASACFGQNNGLVEKGRQADLVILNKNPLEDLSALTSAAYVVNKGEVLSADTIINESAEMIVQRQVNAYNARNIDAFLNTYADDIELYDPSGKLMSKGKEAMRNTYEPIFKDVTNLHCQIVNRISLNNTVIDHERVRFGKQFIQAIAVYEVKDGKIVRVSFKQ